MHRGGLKHGPSRRNSGDLTGSRNRKSVKEKGKSLQAPASGGGLEDWV